MHTGVQHFVLEHSQLQLDRLFPQLRIRFVRFHRVAPLKSECSNLTYSSGPYRSSMHGAEVCKKLVLHTVGGRPVKLT